MKKTSIVFLQAVIVLISVIAVIILIRMPLTEGRAKNLDLVHIYTDPLIIYIYVTSIAFFYALYKAFKLLGYIGLNQVFSPGAVAAIKSIKHCALTIAALILLAGVYIRIFHNKEDDPVGFIALCIIGTFASVVVATAAAVFEKVLQNAIDLKTENDLTI